MECASAWDTVTRSLFIFRYYSVLSTSSPAPARYPWACCPTELLATIADHAGQRLCISLAIHSQLVEVESHGEQHLEEAQLLVGGLVHQGRAGGVALGHLADVQQVKRTPFSWGLVVACCIQAPLPALQSPGQGGAPELKTHPVAIWEQMRDVRDVG